MVAEVGYADALKGLWDDYIAWKAALEEAMAEEDGDARRPAGLD